MKYPVFIILEPTELSRQLGLLLGFASSSSSIPPWEEAPQIVENEKIDDVGFVARAAQGRFTSEIHGESQMSSSKFFTT